MKTRILLGLILCLNSSVAASPDLQDLLPRGGQRGTEVTVTLKGDRLEDAREILFYQPGVTTKSLSAKDNKTVEAVLAIAPDAALGEYQFRLRTASGVSYVRTFWVGPFPNAAEVEPNNDLGEAQAVDLNVTVEGFANNEDVDYYKVAAKKGERLSVEIEGFRLGGYRIMFDPYIALRTASGDLVAESDDTGLHRQDGVVSTIAPADGDYIVEVRDSAYVGGSAYRYRTHIGTFPRPMAIYPAGGTAGSELEVTLLGDPKGPAKQTVKLPAVADITESHGVLLTQDGQSPPSANRVRVTNLKNVLEAEPNDELAKATATDLPLPVAFNGILEKEGDTDYFKFTAKKDQKFRLHALGRGVQSPVDTTLAILDAAGKQLSYNDDADGTSDSRIDFTAPADGDFLVRVHDMLKRGGVDYVYRVEATTFDPELTLTMPEQARNDGQLLKAMVAPQGGRFATVVNINRSNFRGDVAFEVTGLPPGVTFTSHTAPAGVSNFPIVFYAAPDAPIGGSLAQLKAKVVGDEKLQFEGLFEQNVDLVRGNPNQEIYHTTDNDRLAVAVAEKAPFTVEIVKPEVPILQDGPLTLKIRTTREEGFDATIVVRMLWRPPGISYNSSISMKNDVSEADYILTAANNAETRDWNVVVRAESTSPKGIVYVCSDLTPITVAPAFVSGKFNLATVEQGKDVKVTCKLEQLENFAGKAKLELLGLPDKATAEPVEITSEMEEAAFTVKTDPDTPKGQHKNLYCELTLISAEKNLPMTHKLAAGGILRVDPVAPVAGNEKEPAKAPEVANAKK